MREPESGYEEDFQEQVEGILRLMSGEMDIGNAGEGNQKKIG